MAITNLILQIEETNTSIVLDADVSQQHTVQASVSEHPVEDGSTVSDNIKVDPETVTITGIVSNSPIKLLGGISFEIGDTADTLFKPEFDFSGVDQGFQGWANSRARTAYDFLRDAMDNGKTFRIINSLKDYESMAMTSLDVPRDAARANILEFTATFRKIVTTELLEIDPVTIEDPKPTSRGTRPGTPPSSDLADKAEGRVSLLKEITGG